MPLLHPLRDARQGAVEGAVEELQFGEQAVGPVEDVLEVFALGSDVAVFPVVNRINHGLRGLGVTGLAVVFEDSVFDSPHRLSPLCACLAPVYRSLCPDSIPRKSQSGRRLADFFGSAGAVGVLAPDDILGLRSGLPQEMRRPRPSPGPPTGGPGTARTRLGEVLFLASVRVNGKNNTWTRLALLVPFPEPAQHLIKSLHQVHGRAAAGQAVAFAVEHHHFGRHARVLQRVEPFLPLTDRRDVVLLAVDDQRRGGDAVGEL